MYIKYSNTACLMESVVMKTSKVFAFKSVQVQVLQQAGKVNNILDYFIFSSYMLYVIVTKANSNLIKITII